MHFISVHTAHSTCLARCLEYVGARQRHLEYIYDSQFLCLHSPIRRKTLQYWGCAGLLCMCPTRRRTSGEFLVLIWDIAGVRVVFVSGLSYAALPEHCA